MATVHNSGQCEAILAGECTLWRGLSSTTLTQAPAGSSGGRFRLWVCKPVGNPGKASGSSGSSGGRHRLWVYGASGQPWKGPSCLCRDQDQASAFPDPTIPAICHNHHNRWLCKQIQSSVKFSNWNAKETALILQAQNV